MSFVFKEWGNLHWKRDTKYTITLKDIELPGFLFKTSQASLDHLRYIPSKNQAFYFCKTIKQI